MELHPVTVSRQADISRMAVHAGGGEDVRPIDRHALRFMDGRRIAMIDMGIVFQVERDRSTVVEPDRHMLWRNPLDLTQRAVLHPNPALGLEEHDAVCAGELPRAPPGLTVGRRARGDTVGQEWE